MSMRGARRALFAAAISTLACAGVASAQELRGIDPNQGKSLVEVNFASKGEAMRLQLEAETYGIEFNEH